MVYRLCFKIYCYRYRKNDFAKRFKILLDTKILEIILLDRQNNFWYVKNI